LIFCRFFVLLPYYRLPAHPFCDVYRGWLPASCLLYRCVLDSLRCCGYLRFTCVHRTFTVWITVLFRYLPRLRVWFRCRYGFYTCTAFAFNVVVRVPFTRYLPQAFTYLPPLRYGCVTAPLLRYLPACRLHVTRSTVTFYVSVTVLPLPYVTVTPAVTAAVGLLDYRTLPVSAVYRSLITCLPALPFVHRTTFTFRRTVLLICVCVYTTPLRFVLVCSRSLLVCVGLRYHPFWLPATCRLCVVHRGYACHTFTVLVVACTALPFYHLPFSALLRSAATVTFVGLLPRFYGYCRSTLPPAVRLLPHVSAIRLPRSAVEQWITLPFCSVNVTLPFTRSDSRFTFTTRCRCHRYRSRLMPFIDYPFDSLFVTFTVVLPFCTFPLTAFCVWIHH